MLRLLRQRDYFVVTRSGRVPTPEIETDVTPVSRNSALPLRTRLRSVRSHMFGTSLELLNSFQEKLGFLVRAICSRIPAGRLTKSRS